MRRKDREVTRHGDLMEMVARFKVCRQGLWDGRDCLLYTSNYMIYDEKKPGFPDGGRSGFFSYWK